jgi:hypothetical protein
MQYTAALTRLALDLNWALGGSLRLKKDDPRTGDQVAAP